MEKRYFIKLLHKYFKSDLTSEERKYLESYYDLFQDEPDILESLNADEKNEFKNEIKGAVWDTIIDKESADQRIKYVKKRNRLMAAAAIVFVILVTGAFFQHGVLSKKEALTNAPLTNVGTPQKANRLIILPDGSKVILKSESKLNYASSFDGVGKREVFLKGEAFFDVTHNASKPFIVHTGKLQTIVEGTAFNIKAMPSDDEITVTVTRGRVRVSKPDRVLGVITPNQEIMYNIKQDNSVMKVIDDNHYLDWKEKDLLFDNVTVAEAATILEQAYKVKIIIDDESVNSQRFTATFLRNGSLEQALKSICEFNGVAYKYDENESVIIFVNESKK